MPQRSMPAALAPCVWSLPARLTARPLSQPCGFALTTPHLRSRCPIPYLSTLHLLSPSRPPPCCMFTAKGDRPSLLENHPDVPDIPDPGMSEQLQVAHIISQLLTSSISGLTDAAKIKDAQGIAIPHTYEIIDSAPWRCRDLLLRVIFNQTSRFEGETVEPPSPVLLALHAACPRIAHMCGAADISERFDKDLDPHPVLSMGVRDMSYNSQAAHVLSHALHAVSFMTPVDVL
ncbi:hypothetical protein DFH07DRAFT_776174 [Mycena maculata]|uniref:Uncharacterized protein n=1 Tax=Mycena maculata TaxID=230809 RepID=A0AAD7N5V3_9AGAR|nr:hypothetical protein DFH07DRAFT_776174 [Mycena maculata]